MSFLLWAVQILVVLLGFGLGVALAGFLLRRFRPGAKVRMGQPAKSPVHVDLIGEVRAWRVPDAGVRRPVLACVARELAPFHPVVLVPLPGNRAAYSEDLRGVAGVSWVPNDRPGPAQILEACKELAFIGPPVVLLEGAGAVEPPREDEEEEAVVADLFNDRPPSVSVLLVLLPDELAGIGPDLVLESVEGGLAESGGRLRFSLSEAGFQSTAA